MKQSKDFFWPSYVDLMTALFLMMLVLFVLSYKLFRDKQADLEKTNAQFGSHARPRPAPQTLRFGHPRRHS